MLTFSIAETPFSFPGSFLCIVPAENGSDQVRLGACTQRVLGPARRADFFDLTLMEGERPVPYSWIAQPHRLDLLGEGDHGLTFTFLDAETLLFEARGVNLRLLPRRPFDALFTLAPDRLLIHDFSAQGVHQLRAAPGTQLRLTAQHRAAPGDVQAIEFTAAEPIVGALRFSTQEAAWAEALPDFSDVLEARSLQYQAWASHIPPVPEEMAELASSAWQVLWANQLPVAGALSRPGLCSSKAAAPWLRPWEACITSLALANVDSELAWNQLLLFFDLQDESGALPAQVSDLAAQWGPAATPLFGWAIRKLALQCGAKTAQPFLEQIYRPLSHATEWWYAVRDPLGEGLPLAHHPLETGWPASSAFDGRRPLQSADLAAMLVLQCESLAFVANALGKEKAAHRWMSRAYDQMDHLMHQAVGRRRFVSRPVGRPSARGSQSLLDAVPLLLGGRLPAELFKTVAAGLEPGGRWLTNWGLASEAPTSQRYDPIAPGRGPIFALPTFLIFDGLVDAGSRDHAEVIARRFCDLCERDPGFWREYDALSGKGLGYPGSSATAAVFLLMAEWLARLNNH